jgi:uncharacterized SAM-binding protein YcdF (DUF218 family)
MKVIIAIIFITLGLWFGGFIYFLSLVPAQSRAYKPDDYKAAEAMVIFTGDNNRISDGLELSNASNIKYILISGVALNSSLNQIVDNYQNKKFYLNNLQIELGRKATNTIGNIQETAEWVQKNNFHSIILVTSNYHVPRCAILFSKKLKLNSLIIYPTFSDKFDKQKWWKNTRSIILIFNEYHKYLVCKFALFLSDR